MNANKLPRQSYPASFKLKVITEAENTSNHAASRTFKVSRGSIISWYKDKQKLQELPRRKRTNRGRAASFVALEQVLQQWNEDKRRQGFIVTRAMIRFEALKLKTTAEFNTLAGINQFRASNGWLQRFMNRYGLSVRARTKIAQKLPAELDEKVMAFHRFVLTQRKRNNYDLSQIANMDETPMCFDMVPSRSVDHVGTKTVMVKTTGHEKSHFTCVLAVTADGIKLAP